MFPGIAYKVFFIPFVTMSVAPIIIGIFVVILLLMLNSLLLSLKALSNAFPSSARFILYLYDLVHLFNLSNDALSSSVKECGSKK